MNEAEQKRLDWYTKKIAERRELNRKLTNYRQRIYDIRNEMKSLVRQRDKITHELSQGKTFEKHGFYESQFAYHAADIKDYILKHLEHNTQKSLAEQSNVSVQTIYQILNDKRQFITENTAERLFNTMDCEWVLSTFDVVPNPAHLGRPPQSQYYEE